MIKQEATGEACNAREKDEKYLEYLVGKTEGKRLDGNLGLGSRCNRYLSHGTDVTRWAILFNRSARIL
jgi:hypothetical protein